MCTCDVTVTACFETPFWDPIPAPDNESPEETAQALAAGWEISPCYRLAAHSNISQTHLLK